MCQKCRDKVEWRFRYDKYKPLKAPGTCSDCRQKKITKAYRTLCDDCSKRRKQCGSCCADFADEVDQNAMVVDGETSGSKRKADTAGSQKSKGRKVSISAGEDFSDDEAMEEAEVNDVVETASEAASSTAPLSTPADWDTRKFTTIASSKYNKSRKVGTVDDTVFVFGDASAHQAEDTSEAGVVPAEVDAVVMDESESA